MKLVLTREEAQSLLTWLHYMLEHRESQQHYELELETLKPENNPTPTSAAAPPRPRSSETAPAAAESKSPSQLDLGLDTNSPIDTSTRTRARGGAFSQDEHISQEEILGTWNSRAGKWKRGITTLNEKRRSKLRARAREARVTPRGLVHLICDEVEQSSWLQESSWVNFDWCITPSYCPKILEGFYRDAKPQHEDSKWAGWKEATPESDDDPSAPF